MGIQLRRIFILGHIEQKLIKARKINLDEKPLLTYQSIRSHIPSTVCHAFFCPLWVCTHKTLKPSRVRQKNSLSYQKYSEHMDHLSEFALDILALRRIEGKLLSSITLAILDEFRPNGPLRINI